jgi:hypothetical protein
MASDSKPAPSVKPNQDIPRGVPAQRQEPGRVNAKFGGRRSFRRQVQQSKVKKRATEKSGPILSFNQFLNSESVGAAAEKEKVQ